MKGFACEQKKYRFNTISETKSNTVHWKYTTCKDGDSYFKICFLNFEVKIHFLANLDQKSQICSFCLEIGTLGILRMRILIPSLVFGILKPNFI